MAILTEKEVEVELGLMDAKIYAEYSDGHIDSIFITVNIDGYSLQWSTLHKYGQICIMENGQLKRDWERLQALLNKDFAKLIERTISKLIA